MSYQHFVLTRFSVKGGWSWTTFPDGWLRTRIELFERYCLPSMAAQTAPGFRWLVFCDETTAPWCLDTLRGYVDACPQLEVGITAPRRRMIDIVNEHLAPETATVVTTRIDSDDAFHRDAIGTIQEYVEPFVASGRPSLLLNFPGGIKYDVRTGVAHAANLDNSPFHTLLEARRPDGVSTVLYGNHSRLHERYVTHQDLSLPAWLQVIHGGNVRNMLTGLEVPWPGLDVAGMFNIVEGDPGDLWTEIPPAAAR